jgi:hypothetical protein
MSMHAVIAEIPAFVAVRISASGGGQPQQACQCWQGQQLG